MDATAAMATFQATALVHILKGEAIDVRWMVRKVV